MKRTEKENCGIVEKIREKKKINKMEELNSN